MEKFYLLEKDRNEEEKRTGKASYKSIITRYIDDLVLCNNIADADPTIWDNINFELEDENGEYIEIYQYFLCNIDEYTAERLKDYGILLSYSDLLGCDVLMVDHWGTSWDYVPTSAELTEDISEV